MSRCTEHRRRIKLGRIPLRSTQRTAKDHAEADAGFKRRWACACGACRIVQSCAHADCIDLAQRLRFLRYNQVVHG
jgi:hypothetical protein